MGPGGGEGGQIGYRARREVERAVDGRDGRFAFFAEGFFARGAAGGGLGRLAFFAEGFFGRATSTQARLASKTMAISWMGAASRERSSAA